MRGTIQRVVQAGAFGGILVMLTGAAPGQERQGPAAGPGPAPDAVIQAMDAMLDDERRTAAEYERILRDHGRVKPFADWTGAERAHAQFIEYLYRDRGLPVPPKRWTPDRARAYRGVPEACAGAAAQARRTVAEYERYVATLTLPSDVRRVFQHNRRVAEHNHLPILEACARGEMGR